MYAAVVKLTIDPEQAPAAAAAFANDILPASKLTPGSSVRIGWTPLTGRG